MLLKPKQIDLEELAVALANVIGLNQQYKNQWSAILNSTFLTAVFSVENGNLVPGQSNFIIPYDYQVFTLFVYRNGVKLVEETEYTTDLTQPGLIQVTLVKPVGPSNGAQFSETIEVNYY